MKINDNTIKKLLNGRNTKDITTAYFENENLIKINLTNYTFFNLQFLSLKKNNLKEIDFIKYFPNLWYLDISNNPVSSFTPLVNKNTFGFLSLTLDQYSLVSFTSLRTMNIAILEVNKEYTFDNLYSISSGKTIHNFPNILMFNRELVYTSFLINVFKENIDQNHLQPFVHIEKNMEMTKINEFISFLKIYIKTVHEIATKELNNPEIEELEKMKINYLLTVYESLSTLNKSYYNIMSIKSEICTYYKFFDKSILETDDFSCQLVILIVLLFYILRIISKSIAVNLIKFILKKILARQISSGEIECVFNINFIFLLGLYLELYSKFNEKMARTQNFNEENNNYKEAINALNMNRFLKNLKKFREKENNLVIIYNHYPNSNLRKKDIHTNLLRFLDKEIFYFMEIVILMQILYDYILLKNIKEYLIKYSETHFVIFLQIRVCIFKYLDIITDLSNNTDLISNKYLLSSNRSFEPTNKNLRNNEETNLRNNEETNIFKEIKLNTHSSEKKIISNNYFLKKIKGNNDEKENGIVVKDSNNSNLCHFLTISKCMKSKKNERNLNEPYLTFQNGIKKMKENDYYIRNLIGVKKEIKDCDDKQTNFLDNIIYNNSNKDLIIDEDNLKNLCKQLLNQSRKQPEPNRLIKNIKTSRIDSPQNIQFKDTFLTNFKQNTIKKKPVYNFKQFHNMNKNTSHSLNNLNSPKNTFYSITQKLDFTVCNNASNKQNCLPNKISFQNPTLIKVKFLFTKVFESSRDLVSGKSKTFSPKKEITKNKQKN